MQKKISKCKWFIFFLLVLYVIGIYLLYDTLSIKYNEFINEQTTKIQVLENEKYQLMVQYDSLVSIENNLIKQITLYKLQKDSLIHRLYELKKKNDLPSIREFTTDEHTRFYTERYRHRNNHSN